MTGEAGILGFRTLGDLTERAVTCRALWARGLQVELTCVHTLNLLHQLWVLKRQRAEERNLGCPFPWCVLVSGPCPRTPVCRWFWEGGQGWGPWAGFQPQSEPEEGFPVQTQTVYAEVGLRVSAPAGEKGFLHGHRLV